MPNFQHLRIRHGKEKQWHARSPVLPSPPVEAQRPKDININNKKTKTK